MADVSRDVVAGPNAARGAGRSARVDCTTPATVDMSPAVVAERLARLEELRRTARALAEDGRRHRAALLGPFADDGDA